MFGDYKIGGRLTDLKGKKNGNCLGTLVFRLNVSNCFT